jgi:hypothetical protein
VVSDAFAFPPGADPKVVGGTVQLDGEPFGSGVMPRAFASRAPRRSCLPLSVLTDDDVPHIRAVRWLNVVARLAPGATSSRSRRRRIGDEYSSDYPEATRVQPPAIVPSPSTSVAFACG